MEGLRACLDLITESRNRDYARHAEAKTTRDLRERAGYILAVKFFCALKC